MNTNIVISLDTRRPKKDGTFPLIMRLGHNERTTSIPLKVNLLEKDWDDDKKVVKNSHKEVSSVTRLNNSNQRKKADAMEIIIDLDKKGILNALSITEVKNRIVQADTNASFFSYAEGLANELIKANQVGTARSYKGVVAVLKTFNQQKDLRFKDITYNFLVKFETYHKSRGNGVNGLSVYMRAIRAIYNKAIKAGLAEEESYPFKNYKIKGEPTQKRALDFGFIKKIIDLELDPSDALFNTRNYFLASYMMYGMNFMDMAYLKKSDISNGRIEYRRKKTSKLYDIKVIDSLQVILDHYKSDSPFVFPILKRQTAVLQDRDIQGARKRYNKKLKVLAELCGIDKKLTSYVSRHSFATQAMLQNVPLNAISSMLGHSSLKTTQIYLKSLPTNILDDYNTKILQG